MAQNRGVAGLLPPRWTSSMDAATSRAVSAEFLGTLVFVFLANTSKTALGVGLAYTISSYLTAPISSGHLNPCISLAQMFSGHAHSAVAGLYVVAQILGAIVASLLEAFLLPGIHIGRNLHFKPAGCFALHNAGFFKTIIWEAGLTFLVVSVVYATAVGRKEFNAISPLAVGLAIYVAIESGGVYTGAILNPARLIGPAVVFLCGWKRFWFNLVGQLIGAAAAAGFAISSFGTGVSYSANGDDLEARTGLGDRLMPEGESSI